MSRRTHFWIRIAGLAIIVLAELLPRYYAKDRTASAAERTTASAQSYARVGLALTTNGATNGAR
jgi:hypothetical protein